jgi:hypothetical protein
MAAKAFQRLAGSPAEAEKDILKFRPAASALY